MVTPLARQGNPDVVNICAPDPVCPMLSSNIVFDVNRSTPGVAG